MVRGFGLAVCLVLTACTVGPEYVRPSAPVPASYKWEAGWREARPADAIERGAWWSVFGDPTLDALLRQVEISNQNLAAAEAGVCTPPAVGVRGPGGFFPPTPGERAPGG